MADLAEFWRDFLIAEARMEEEVAEDCGALMGAQKYKFKHMSTLDVHDLESIGIPHSMAKVIVTAMRHYLAQEEEVLEEEQEPEPSVGSRKGSMSLSRTQEDDDPMGHVEEEDIGEVEPEEYRDGEESKVMEEGEGEVEAEDEVYVEDGEEEGGEDGIYNDDDDAAHLEELQEQLRSLHARHKSNVEDALRDDSEPKQESQVQQELDIGTGARRATSQEQPEEQQDLGPPPNCSNCDSPGEVTCGECGGAVFCAICAIFLHKSAAKKSHTRTALPKRKPARRASVLEGMKADQKTIARLEKEIAKAKTLAAKKVGKLQKDGHKPPEKKGTGKIDDAVQARLAEGIEKAKHLAQQKKAQGGGKKLPEVHKGPQNANVMARFEKDMAKFKAKGATKGEKAPGTAAQGAAKPASSANADDPAVKERLEKQMEKARKLAEFKKKKMEQASVDDAPRPLPSVSSASNVSAEVAARLEKDIQKAKEKAELKKKKEEQERLEAERKDAELRSKVVATVDDKTMLERREKELEQAKKKRLEIEKKKKEAEEAVQSVAKRKESLTVIPKDSEELLAQRDQELADAKKRADAKRLQLKATMDKAAPKPAPLKLKIHKKGEDSVPAYTPSASPRMSSNSRTLPKSSSSSHIPSASPFDKPEKAPVPVFEKTIDKQQVSLPSSPQTVSALNSLTAISTNNDSSLPHQLVSNNPSEASEPLSAVEPLSATGEPSSSPASASGSVHGASPTNTGSGSAPNASGSVYVAGVVAGDGEDLACVVCEEQATVRCMHCGEGGKPYCANCSQFLHKNPNKRTHLILNLARNGGSAQSAADLTKKVSNDLEAAKSKADDRLKKAKDKKNSLLISTVSTSTRKASMRKASAPAQELAASLAAMDDQEGGRERSDSAEYYLEMLETPAPKCGLCDSAKAELFCQDCSSSYCAECNTDVHKATSKRKHFKRRYKVRTKKFAMLVSCYLCGQQFSTASLVLHYDSCKIKRRLILRELPEQLRPSLPKPPTTPVPDDDTEIAGYKAFNDEVTKIYQDSCMVQCPHNGCGRRFEPDRAMKHINNCPKKN